MQSKTLVDFDVHLGAQPRHEKDYRAKMEVKGSAGRPSGCGKTTLLRCLNRTCHVTNWQPHCGESRFSLRQPNERKVASRSDLVSKPTSWLLRITG